MTCPTTTVLIGELTLLGNGTTFLLSNGVQHTHDLIMTHDLERRKQPPARLMRNTLSLGFLFDQIPGCIRSRLAWITTLLDNQSVHAVLTDIHFLFCHRHSHTMPVLWTYFFNEARFSMERGEGVDENGRGRETTSALHRGNEAGMD